MGFVLVPVVVDELDISSREEIPRVITVGSLGLGWVRGVFKAGGEDELQLAATVNDVVILGREEEV